MRKVHPLVLAVSAVASVCAAQPTPPPQAAEVSADAAARSLPPAGAGHDGRFFVASADNKFRLQLQGEIQFRYYGTVDAEGSSDDDYEHGFQLNRVRLDFRGHVIDPKLTYRILTNIDRATGSMFLQDAYGEYAFAKGWKVRWGQFKVPFDREFSMTNPTEVQAVDNSLVSNSFRIDRSQGVMLAYEADRWRAFGTFSDGRAAANTAFNSAAESDFAITTRLETRLGEAGWRQFRDHTAFRGDKQGVMLGLAGHWQQEGGTTAPTSSRGTADLIQYTADVSYESDGWNLLAAIVGRTSESNNVSLSDYGIVAQGGYFVTDNVEGFARYTHIFPDNERGGDDQFSGIGGGVTVYFIPKSHAVKLTIEGTYYPTPANDSAAVVRTPETSSGILADSNGGQFGLIVQMQIVF